MIYVADVMVDGNVIDWSWNMPYSVGALIEHFGDTIPIEPDSEDFGFSWNASSIAESVFGAEYESKWSIKSQVSDSILKSKHPKAHEFLEEISEFNRKEQETE